MNRIKKISLIAVLFAVSLVVSVFAACANNEPKKEHTHNYKIEWTSDETYHWHDCQNENCEEPQGSKAVHADNNDDGKCDTCNYITDEIKGSLLTFKLSNNTYSVSGASNLLSGSLIIPSTYKNINVTSIGTGALGFYAFGDCPNLKSVIIPNSINSIEAASFSGCNNIESISIPFVGAKMDGSGYTHFGHIFSAYTANNFNSYVPASLKAVTVTGGTTIGEEAFRYCNGIEEITLPESVVSIGNSAFRDCTKLTTIKFQGTSEQWASISKGLNAIPSTVNVLCLGDNV